MAEDHAMSEELKEEDYEVTIIAKVAGNDKSTTHKFPVKARSNVEAMVKGEEVWRQSVEPSDIRVRKNPIIKGS